jgi:hypothetical protein
MPYLGTQAPTGFKTTTKQSFSGDNSTTTFTLNRASSSSTDLEIFVDNIQQEPTTAYSVSGTTLTFTEAPPTGTNNVYVVNRGGDQNGLLPPQDLGTTDYIFGDDISFNSDGAVINFGADSEITITHVADTGLNFKHTATGDDKPIILTLQTGETDIAADDVLGTINFQAPDEGTGTDAILVAAGIEAVSEGDFSSSSNATKLSFKTASSAAAAETMSLSSAGLLTIADDLVIGDGKTIGTTSDPDALLIASDGSVSTPTAGTSNTRFGVNAGNSIASGGNYNVFIGDEAGTALTTGDNNVAVGFEALSTEDGNGHNTAIGYRALKTLDAGNTGNNVAVGANAGLSVTTGRLSVLIGSEAGDAITSANSNVAIGFQALSADTQGDNSVAIGDQALAAQNFTSSTDSFNTAVGSNAGLSVTTGTENTLIGALAGDAMTDADRNTVVGYLALTTNTKSDRNTAIGRSALENLNHTSVTSGLNVAVGHGAGSLLTTGEKNTIIGSYSGNQDSLDIRTADSNIVIADGDGNTRLFYKHSTLNWNIKVPAASNNALIVNNTGGSDEFGVQIVNSTDRNDGTGHFISCVGSSTARFKVFTNGNAVNTNNSYGAISDEKLKENIEDSGSQWDDIKSLRIRKFSMKEDKLGAPNKIGVIAQELEASGMNGLVVDTPDLDNDLKDLGTVTKTVNYSILYMKAVKALQEAMTRIETLESKVKTLEGE